MPLVSQTEHMYLYYRYTFAKQEIFNFCQQQIFVCNTRNWPVYCSQWINLNVKFFPFNFPFVISDHLLDVKTILIF